MFKRSLLHRSANIKKLKLLITFFLKVLKDNLAWVYYSWASLWQRQIKFGTMCLYDLKQFKEDWINHFHIRRLCQLYWTHLKYLRRELKFLKTNPIINLIEMEERLDGTLHDEEIIFFHDSQWFVITTKNLFMMQPTVCISNCSKKMKATILNQLSSRRIDFSLSFEFQMSNCRATINCDIMIQHFGYDVVKKIFKLMKETNVMQVRFNGVLYNIMFDTTKNPSESMILVDPNLKIWITVGTFNMCSVCCKCVPKKKMKKHMEAHTKAEKEQVLGNNPTIICCPICNTFLDKTNKPVEECNHIRCPLPSCGAAICYRCNGVRSIRGESKLPPEKTFEVQSVQGALSPENPVEDKKTRLYAPYCWNSHMDKIVKSVPVCSERCSTMHNLHNQLQIKNGILRRVVCCNGTDIHIETPSARNNSTEEQLADMGMPPEEIEPLRQQQAMLDHITNQFQRAALQPQINRNQIQRTALRPQINMREEDVMLWRLFLQIPAQHLRDVFR